MRFNASYSPISPRPSHIIKYTNKTIVLKYFTEQWPINYFNQIIDFFTLSIHFNFLMNTALHRQTRHF